jgi:hypothetical protein
MATRFSLQVVLRKQIHNQVPPFVAGEIRNQLCIVDYVLHQV